MQCEVGQVVLRIAATDIWPVVSWSDSAEKGFLRSRTGRCTCMAAREPHLPQDLALCDAFRILLQNQGTIRGSVFVRGQGLEDQLACIWLEAFVVRTER